MKNWQARFLHVWGIFRLWTQRFFLPWNKWGHAVELSLIVAWALWVGREFLNFDPGVWPTGGEFPMVVQSHYIWNLFVECGSCIFWNGFQNGGAPAFIELHGAPLNPVVILTTLGFGVINGAKLTLIISLVLAGWAQWWIARSLQLSVVPRLWGALLVVVAGHLAGKMEIGGLTLVLSTAFASLVIAAGLNLALYGKQKTALGLGVLLALTFTAGQGYLQVGLLFAIFPALILLMFDDRLNLKPVWKDFLLAGGLGLLLAGIFLVPFLNFWPNFSKAIDPQFESAQAIQNIPLTWVIDNAQIYRESTITPQPHAYLYINYVGWIPILFSLVAIRLVPRRKTRLLAFFLVALLLILLASNGFIFNSLRVLHPNIIGGIRNIPLIVGLSAPLIIALAAWGLECTLGLNWPTVTWSSDSGRGLKFKVTWLILALPLVWSIRSAYMFTEEWLQVRPPPQEVEQVTELIELDSVQWIVPPFGEHYWLPALLENGYKLTNVVRPWNWRENPDPPGQLYAIRGYSGVLNDNYLGEAGGISLLKDENHVYAAVRTVKGKKPCQSEARGGHITVTCETDVFGDLYVMEHSMSGWTATMDGEEIDLRKDRWLNVFAPEGRHVYEFRYRPWDVPIGAFLTLLGILILGWFWIKERRKKREGE